MRIVSQSKELSVNLEHVLLMVDDKVLMAKWSDGKIYVLGRYRSEECAIEVLNDIHDAIWHESEVFFMPPIESV